MKGRFILDDVEFDDREQVSKILKDLPVIAEPSLKHPLGEVFFNNSKQIGKISKNDLRAGLVFRVAQPSECADGACAVDVYPVRTPIYEEVTFYDLRRLPKAGWKLTEFWRDGQIVLENRQGGRRYEVALHIREP